MKFEKAIFQEISSKPSANPQTVGPEIEVQINPATLRLQMANTVDAGKAFGRPNTQYQGTSSSTLSFDLVFDTADEGTTKQPVDVRTRTRQLERFLLPSTKSPKSVPPRVQFSYGTLTIVGVLTALNQDFDLFSTNGVPLRAKCAVTIKEQKPEFDAKLAGPGANTGAGATPPVAPGAGPGAGAGAGAGPGAAPPRPDRTGTALAGESAADFANRMGLDPRAWKGLAAGLPDPLRLAAGLRIDFSASLSADAGIGLQAGATAGGPAEPEPAGGAPSGPIPAQAPADGPQLTAQGGLSRALDHAAAERAGQAAAHARAAFDPETAAAPAPATPAPAAPTPARPAPPAPAPAVTADPRAVSYGFGVPLRPRLGVASSAAIGLVHEHRRGVPPAAGDAPETDDPTVPGWQALPARSETVPGGTRAAGCGGCGCGGRGGARWPSMSVS
jgi:hypothetical protein